MDMSTNMILNSTRLLVGTKQACEILGGISPRTLRKWTSDFGITPLRRGYYLYTDIVQLVNQMKNKRQKDEYLNLKELGL